MKNAKPFDDNRPFSGLKVLDLSSVLAGPLTASFFAELGADVVKIENKLTGGDATRQWKLASEDAESPVSAYYFSANYGKKIKLLDLNLLEARQEVEILMAQSDIIVSNFQKKVAEKLNLLPDDIINKYPGIIMAQLSAYDFDDPRPGYDLVMQGDTGWISMNGTDIDHLAKLPVAIIDIFAAHQMKEAILIALYKKIRTGVGSVIHVSLYKSAISGLANQASNYLMQHHIPKPLGTLHPNIAPYGDIFTSKDKIKFLLAVGSDAQFKKLWFTLNLPPEKYHTFDDNSKRLNARGNLQAILQHVFGTLHFESIKGILEPNNVPYCCIKDLNGVFEDSLAKEMIKSQTIENKTGQSVSSIAFKIK